MAEIYQRVENARPVDVEVNDNGRYIWPFSKMKIGETVVMGVGNPLKKARQYAGVYGHFHKKKYVTRTFDRRLYITRLA